MNSCINIETDCLSRAWAQAFLALWQCGEIQPLVVSVAINNEGPSSEVPEIRAKLDALLLQYGKSSCDTVANTIFPSSLWNPSLPGTALFERYLRVYPRLKRSDSRNQYGTYFHRMIAFGPSCKNQLDHIISTRRRGNLRRSALQVAIMDPKSDLTHQRRRGFPCLQHVIFTPVGDDGLAVTGIYATQELTEKGYGNYLGLYNLGLFVAQEMDLRLTRMTCFSAIAKLKGSTLRKKDLLSLRDDLAAHIVGYADNLLESPIETTVAVC